MYKGSEFKTKQGGTNLKIEYIDGSLLKKMFIGAANSLEKNKEMLNALNVFPVPDGDTGTNMTLTMQAAVREIRNSDIEDVEKIASLVSNGSLMGARGNSGVILSQVLRGFAKALEGVEKVDVAVMADALDRGAKTAYRAVMKPIEGTILTVARESAEAGLEILDQEDDLEVFLDQVIEAGRVSLDKTPDLLPVLKEAGVVDAGGMGFVVILQGMLSGLNGEELIDEQADIESSLSFDKINIEGEDSDIEFGYCTEFIINNNKDKSEIFADQIKNIGDSMMVVDGDGFIKVHVHTNDPGVVLDKALKVGELIDIKIDNMRYQHSSNFKGEEYEKKEVKEYGFITVAMGEGIRNIFKDLNVDHIIAGGQTMNPSTEDLLKAVNGINAENIIILPNNSNIVLAANQTKELSDKNVTILPTKTIPQGITALLEFNEELDLEDNVRNMTDAFSRMKTSQITFSVRDTTLDGKEIKKDDILGINDGKLTLVGKNIQELTLDLIDKTITDDSELITIFYGEDITEEEGSKIIDVLEEKYSDLDIELIYGGQPIYYYLIAIE